MPKRGPNRKLKRGDKREATPRPRTVRGSRDLGIVSGILLMGLGALIALALGSSTRAGGNLAGAVGSWLAARLLTYLGLLSFLVPVAFACLSLEALHLFHWNGRRAVRLAAGFAGALAVTLVGQILWPDLRALGSPPGGALVRLLAAPLVAALSTAGSVLVVSVLGMAALAVASDYALSRAGAWLLRALWALSRKGLSAAWVWLRTVGHAAWREHLEARAEPEDSGIDPSALEAAAEDEVQLRSDLAARRGASEDPDEWSDDSVEQLSEEDIEELQPEILMVGLDGRVRGANRKTPPPIELPTPESVEEAAAEPAVESAPNEALAPSPSSGSSPSPSIIETQALEPTKRKPKRGAFRLLQTGKGFKLPSLDLLESTPEIRSDIDRNALTDTAQRLTAKLADFGIKGRVETIRPGPVITMYEFVPAPGIRVSKIASLADDLAMAMEALQVRIVAPIPGKNVVGIEVPNRHRAKVTLKEMLEDEAFQKMTSPLTLAFGKDTEGAPYVGDLTRMPHLLVAGTTGSGKSVSMNSMIMSLLFKASPDDVRLILIDPKMVELSAYEGIPHLLLPVVQDSQKAPLALRWAVDEMERRYQLIGRLKVKDIRTYNEKVEQLSRGEKLEEPATEAPKKVLVVDVAAGETEEEALALMQQGAKAEPKADRTEGATAQEAAADPEVKLPYIVIIIDELADLMMVASREMEQCIARLAAKARAAGIHLVVATQRPSTDVISGVIKSNLPVRIAFRLASRHDSATIINGPGAERLLGEGDMLHIPPGGSDAIRLHGALVRETEIERVVDFWKKQAQPIYDEEILRPRPEDREGGGPESVPDEIYDQALDVVGRLERVSISLLQRKMGVGYNRAADLIERMEREGVVGPANGVKPREVLIRPLGQMEA